ncbi:MAG: FecR family protein [Candidatus Omnitrophota bacterium]|jgi:ferric-dicitrate binding protein FerR (iron transport regulator)
MRKNFLPVVAVVSLLVLGLIGFISFLQAAEVVFTEGSVQVQSADKVWKKAEAGTQVDIGDSIRTARKSRADVALDDEKMNTLRISEQTMVVLNSTEPGMINKIDLSNGKIYSNVENLKAGLAFEVSTPSAVAGVRGTGWSVESSKLKDEVATFKDTVKVKTFDANNNLLTETDVPEGFKTIIERFQQAGALTQLTEQEMQQWTEIRQEVTQHVENPPSGGGNEGADEDTQNLDQTTELQENVVNELDDSKDQIEDQQTDENVEKIRSFGHYSQEG